MLAFTQLALNAGRDREQLEIELQGLEDLEIEIEKTGFTLAEINVLLGEAGQAASDVVGTPVDAMRPVAKHAR